MKIVEFANSVDGAAHNEPPHVDLHCLSFSLVYIRNIIYLYSWRKLTCLFDLYA